MGSPLSAVIDAIGLEYHPESWDIEAIEIRGFLAEAVGLEILLLRSERDDLEHRFADHHFLGIDELSGYPSDIGIERAGSAFHGSIFDSRRNAAIALGV